jgi:hypothetical protein
MSGIVIISTTRDLMCSSRNLPFLKGHTAACKPTLQNCYISTKYQLKGPATKSVTNPHYPCCAPSACRLRGSQTIEFGHLGVGLKHFSSCRCHFCTNKSRHRDEFRGKSAIAKDELFTSLQRIPQRISDSTG